MGRCQWPIRFFPVPAASLTCACHLVLRSFLLGVGLSVSATRRSTEGSSVCLSPLLHSPLSTAKEGWPEGRSCCRDRHRTFHLFFTSLTPSLVAQPGMGRGQQDETWHVVRGTYFPPSSPPSDHTSLSLPPLPSVFAVFGAPRASFLGPRLGLHISPTFHQRTLVLRRRSFQMLAFSPPIIPSSGNSSSSPHHPRS